MNQWIVLAGILLGLSWGMDVSAGSVPTEQITVASPTVSQVNAIAMKPVKTTSGNTSNRAVKLLLESFHGNTDVEALNQALSINRNASPAKVAREGN